MLKSAFSGNIITYLDSPVISHLSNFFDWQNFLTIKASVEERKHRLKSLNYEALETELSKELYRICSVLNMLILVWSVQGLLILYHLRWKWELLNFHFSVSKSMKFLKHIRTPYFCHKQLGRMKICHRRKLAFCLIQGRSLTEDMSLSLEFDLSSLVVVV